MSYVQRVLQPGETVRHTAAIHWIVYWPGALLAGLGLVMLMIGLLAQHPFLWVTAALVVGGVGLFLLIPEWLTWWTTEVAVTNHRVIYKTGFIRLATNEMNMDKVESVQVNQSILGRVLNYGDVVIAGTGEGIEKLKSVSNPIDLRNSITGVSAQR